MCAKFRVSNAANARPVLVSVLVIFKGGPHMVARAANEEDGLRKVLVGYCTECGHLSDRLTIPVSAVRCCDWKKTASLAVQ